MRILKLHEYFLYLHNQTNKNMIGYHYSSRNLEKNDLIISKQHRAITFEIFYPIYNEVCKEILNRELPKEYGYAYPIQKKHNLSLHIVESNDYIIGNFNHSLYLMMECLSTSWKSLPTLKERIASRKELIRIEAIKYFTDIQDINNQELISSTWKII